LQNLRIGPRLLPPASPSLFLYNAAHCPLPAFSLAASCPFAVLPLPPLPRLARPPLNRPCCLLLTQTRRAAARLSCHARRRPPAAPCRPPACLFLAWDVPSKLLLSSIPSRAPAFLFSSPLDYFAGAPLSTAVSRLRRFCSPISCSTSTAASHYPFLIHSSSSSRARAAQNIAPMISLSAAVLILVEPKFHPFSFSPRPPSAPHLHAEAP
jgi:hypothetical protein